MKIVIYDDEVEWPIDTEQPASANLDDLIDTFGREDVRRILDDGLRTFQQVRDLFNAEED